MSARACRCLGVFAALAIVSTPLAASAFDLEDYATTYRATRDAMLKALNEVRLAHTAYMEIRAHAVMHGWDPHDEDWQMPPGLVAGSCESPPGKAFGSNIFGPAIGHAMGNFVREMADVLSPEAWDAIFAHQELIATYFRASRDYYLKLTNQVMLATHIPTQSLASECTDQVYYTDYEDLLTTLRARRDAYLKAINEYSLSIPPYKAALAAYHAATEVYTHGIACDPGPFIGPLPKP